MGGGTDEHEGADRVNEGRAHEIKEAPDRRARDGASRGEPVERPHSGHRFLSLYDDGSARRCGGVCGPVMEWGSVEPQPRNRALRDHAQIDDLDPTIIAFPAEPVPGLVQVQEGSRQSDGVQRDDREARCHSLQDRPLPLVRAGGGEEEDIPGSVQVRQSLFLVPEPEVPPPGAELLGSALQARRRFTVAHVGKAERGQPRRRRECLLVAAPRGDFADRSGQEELVGQFESPPRFPPPGAGTKAFR